MVYNIFWIIIRGAFLIFFKILFYLTLQYCIGFAIYQNESATGIHVFPILNPPPSFKASWSTCRTICDLGLIQAGNVLGYLILRMEYHAKMRYMLPPKY